ncbi:MAG: glutathione S-transferase family protein [Betaproteobacteria bacterium]|nr:glutathione S-transferase family protein [Betaproteobacteria bacterium]
MIIVHHLNDSRSQRILWLLEELGLPYEIHHHPRDPKTRFAPDSLKAVHALGKAPTITDGGLTIAESGAIIDYIIRRHGSGRLQPAANTADYDKYQEWLHYAEGSAMFPLLMKMYMGRIGAAAEVIAPRVDGEIARHLGYINRSLAGRTWLMGDTFTGADVQLSFIGEYAGAQGLRAPYENLEAWVKRCQARPAYLKAVDKGGPYRFAV